jgi:hypothetical protein
LEAVLLSVRRDGEEEPHTDGLGALEKTPTAWPDDVLVSVVVGTAGASSDVRRLCLIAATWGEELPPASLELVSLSENASTAPRSPFNVTCLKREWPYRADLWRLVDVVSPGLHSPRAPGSSPGSGAELLLRYWADALLVHPKAKWFVKTGLDTYLTSAVLRVLLARFDSAKPWCAQDPPS